MPPVSAGRAEALILAPEPAVTIRPAGDADVEPMLDLVENQAFVHPLTRADLRRLFTIQWDERAPLRGFVLEDDGGHLLGCLGVISSPPRHVAGRRLVTANLHTMFVDSRRRYHQAGGSARRYSLDLLAASTSLGVPVTALTARGPGEVVPRLLSQLSFEAVSDGDVFSSRHAAMLGALRQPGTVVSSREAVDRWLDEEQQRIVADHRALGCGCHVLHDGGRSCLIITRRRQYPVEWLWPFASWRRIGRRRVPVTDILHLSDADLAGRSWDRLVSHVSRAEASLGVSCATAIRPTSARPTIPRKMFVHGRQTPPGSIDKLYSELALLP
ncbi:MAG: hypothetical protein AB7O32_13565 [Vicinamibacterales bacterium]